MNRPPTPDARLEQEKEPSVVEIINIKVRFLIFFWLKAPSLLNLSMSVIID